MLDVHGWFLPDYVYEQIEIYSENYEFLGNAVLHQLRLDVLKNYPRFGNARAGWKAILKLEKPLLCEQIRVICKRSDKIIKEILCPVQSLGSKSILYTEIWDSSKNMLDYAAIKRLSKTTHMPIGEMINAVKKITQKKVVLLYGNCQIICMNSLLAGSSDFTTSFIILNLPPIYKLGNEEKEYGLDVGLLESIDILIYQIISETNKFSKKLSSNNLLRCIRKDCLHISIPNAYYEGYFPQFVANKKYSPYQDKYRNGIMPCGDKNIEKMYLVEGKGVDTIIQEILSESFYSVDEVQAGHKKSLDELKSREKECDVMISDYIEERYSVERLFYTINHPINKLLTVILERAFLLVGIHIKDWSYEKAIVNDNIIIPIYPSVIKGLALEFNQEKFCWHRAFKKEKTDMAEFVQDYIKYCFSENMIN